MNNYCRNCGKKLENDIKVCPVCNAEVFENRINVSLKKEELIKNKQKERKYLIAIGILFTVGLIEWFLTYFFESIFFYSIYPLVFLSAIIVLITAKVALPQSKIIKVLFYILIAIIILYSCMLMFILARCFYDFYMMGLN